MMLVFATSWLLNDKFYEGISNYLDLDLPKRDKVIAMLSIFYKTFSLVYTMG